MTTPAGDTAHGPAATFERIQATNAEIVEEPTDQPYGVRDCAVRDPGGNLTRVQERR